MGAIVAYPTEGVFGLGCDPKNRDAVARLVELKGRAHDKGLIVVGGSRGHVAPFLGDITVAMRTHLNTLWPGPVTFIAPAAPGLDPLLTGGRDTIALRVSAHSTVVALCEACGHALVSTSANPSGVAPLPDAEALASTFGAAIAGVVTGSLGGHPGPTPIFELESGKRLR